VEMSIDLVEKQERINEQMNGILENEKLEKK